MIILLDDDCLRLRKYLELFSLEFKTVKELGVKKDEVARYAMKTTF
jgi:hypothetical protein